MKGLPKKWWLQGNLLLLLFFRPSLNAQSFQNLVINGSFETYTQCPTTITKIHYAPPWTGPTTDESGYLNACSQMWNVPNYGGSYGYLEAKQGVAYAQLMVLHTINGQDYRNFAQTQLSDSLNTGGCYFVEFFASNLQWTKYRVNNISGCFTPSMLPTNLLSPGLIPNLQTHITNYNNPVLEDTVKWIAISGVYQAIGGEKYLSIGNFKDNASTDTINIYPPGSYPYSSLPSATSIFIDAVSVYSLNPSGILPWTYRDTSVFIGDSVYIGNKMGGLNFHPQWFDINGNYITTNAGIFLKPTTTSSYVINYTVCGVARADTVVVTVNENVIMPEQQLWMNDLKIFPNPANTFITLSFDHNQEIKFNSIRIFNQLGQVIREEEINFKNKAAVLSTIELTDGVYSMELIGDDSFSIRKRLVISH